MPWRSFLRIVIEHRLCSGQTLHAHNRKVGAWEKMQNLRSGTILFHSYEEYYSRAVNRLQEFSTSMDCKDMLHYGVIAAGQQFVCEYY